jgi:aspartate racemase
MHTPQLAEYVRRIDRGDWQGVAELMLASASKLAAIVAGGALYPRPEARGGARKQPR